MPSKNMHTYLAPKIRVVDYRVLLKTLLEFM